MAYKSNNIKSFRTDIAEFMIEQRNVGFVENDGQWLVNQLPELHWSNGFLRQCRPGKFLGVFADMDAVNVVVSAAKVLPIEDEEVRSIGRVSC